MRVFIIILLNAVTINAWATNKWEEISIQDLSKIYERVSNFYLNSDAYYFTINHSSFSDSITSQPSESIKGFYYKDESSYYMNVLGSEILQVKKHKFTVMQDSKEIMIQDAEEDLQVDVLERQKSMKKFIDQIYMTHQANFTQLKISYHSVVPYSEIHLKIDDTGFVHEMTLYFKDEVEWTDKNGGKQLSKPRMEIKYQLHPERVKSVQLKMKTDPIAVESKNNEWTLSPKYVGYKVTDLRINNK